VLCVQHERHTAVTFLCYKMIDMVSTAYKTCRIYLTIFMYWESILVEVM